MLKWNDVPAAPSVSIRTWMIIAITAFVVIVVAAIVLLLPATTPPIIPSTSETPTAPEEPIVAKPETPPIEEPLVPVEPIVVTPAAPPVDPPDDFIVPNNLWQNAFHLNRADGTPLHRAIGFSEIPVGTKLYAPMDGRVHFFWNREGTPEESHMVMLAKPGWDTEANQNVRSMMFLAKDLEVLNWEPKEGEPFAIIRDAGELVPGFHDRTVSFIAVVDPWAETLSDRSITDPRVYIQKAIAKIN